MSNAFLTTATSCFTIFIELALPYAILSARSWIRKASTLALKGMHLGIMTCMGLVCFGLLMIGAVQETMTPAARTSPGPAPASERSGGG
ncbi:hypothetical protein ACIRJO_32085 [Streptomyces sp. NPDC102394]|uniref:hypothetical protein n=1 Tax=Streptomyces sp. NPDC102394 TaxID=3366167 RepID=UPI0038082E60